MLMLITGLAMHSASAKAGLTSCGNPSGSSCEVPFGIFSHEYEGWAQFLPRFLEFLPGVLGVFVGAPLVARELESGTFRFAWTQGRTRVQWITTKLLLLGASLTAVALVFSLLFTWWFGPWHSIMGRMNWWASL
jgi:ABC-type transport system involved in multi-copper enzyme maturation permease subunit